MTIRAVTIICGVVGLFSVASAFAGEPNDNFSAAVLLTGSAGAGTGSVGGATVEAGEPPHGGVAANSSVWYSITAPGAGAVSFSNNSHHGVGVFTGDAVGRLTEVRPQIAGLYLQGETSFTRFKVRSGVTYYISVNGPYAVVQSYGNPPQFDFSWRFDQVPANDDFSNAAVISGPAGSVTGSARVATTESTEPNTTIAPYYGPAGTNPYSPSGSVWYSWTAPADGIEAFDGGGGASGLIFQGSFPDRVHIYSGSTLSALTELPAKGSTYTWITATAGTRYWIQVMRDIDSFTLHWSPGPANDNFAAATVLSGASGSISATLEGATAASDDPKIWTTVARETVWYSWTSPADGLYTFDVATKFFPVLGIYTGDTIGNLSLVDAGNLGTGAPTADLTIHALAGTTYWIMVGKHNDYYFDSAGFTLSWRQSSFPSDAALLNLSTRANVGTGDRVLIGGFIVAGDQPKKVILRAIGPSLQSASPPVANALVDPQLELRNGAGDLIYSNDDWRNSPQKDQIASTGIPPQSDKESAIVASLVPAQYTAIVRGANSGTGIGLVEIYDLQPESSRLLNISTRGFAGTGADQLIAGWILGGSFPAKLAVRGLGPSIAATVSGALADPEFFVRNSAGEVLTAAGTNNWREDPDTSAEVQFHRLAPVDDREAARIMPYQPGSYTALLHGANNGTGIGLIEIYNVD